jgi:hypothetical protein
MNRFIVGCMLVIASISLASCSSSHARGTAPSVSATASSGTTETDASSIASPSSQAQETNPTRCHTSELRGGFHNYPNGAAGNDRFDVQVTNITSQACTVDGYPGLAFLTAARHPIKIAVVRGSGMLTKDTGPHQLLLGLGQTASASVAYTPSCNTPAEEEASQAAYVELTPPDETDFLLAPVTMPAGTSLAVCGSQVFVTAMVAGGSGTPTS